MPIIRDSELDIISYSAEQTLRFGIRLGLLLQVGDVICLSGDMGAGKTVFAKGIGRGWGSMTPITSPTYNLIHEHRKPDQSAVLYHLDCYRLRGVQDAESIGLSDVLDDPKGLVVLEWAEQIEDLIPKDHLWIELRVVENQRRNFFLEASGQRYTALIDAFRSSIIGFKS
ncbi:tRNA (adenosine(37)-N6)-threonylcarbamoyltransferase complex ATPase subunit type 1 TsaE [Anaerolineales bacterium]